VLEVAGYDLNNNEEALNDVLGKILMQNSCRKTPRNDETDIVRAWLPQWIMEKQQLRISEILVEAQEERHWMLAIFST